MRSERASPGKAESHLGLLAPLAQVDVRMSGSELLGRRPGRPPSLRDLDEDHHFVLREGGDA
ncbi:hypothetical protein [Streptomyces sp. NPDC058335]|uniref:hypothetical protein n=1 Tax=Streptomyces sp. NPDC058335 TaxID=3346451 RepID=UPI00365D7AE7